MTGAGADAVTIRRFAAADEDGFVALVASEAGGQPWNEPRAALQRKLAWDGELVFVAAIEQRIVGTVQGGYDGVRGWIYGLVVAPTERRRGLGTRLVRTVESALAALGCPKINLQVRATNTAVIPFYQSLGYEIEERVSFGKAVDRARTQASESDGETA